MTTYNFRLDNTEGYTEAELDALNQEQDAYVEEQREWAEENGNGAHFDEIEARKTFADMVANR